LRYCVLLIALFSISFPAGLSAQEPDPQKKDCEKLEERIEQLETDVLLIQTDMPDETEDESLKPKRFTSLTRSLQAANPEISFSGDIIAQYIRNNSGQEYMGHERSGFGFRALGIHLQSNLDPFSLTKIAVEILPEEGAVLEEAYVTWTAVTPGLSITAGMFRQQLGVVNRWHEDMLDQSSYPLMLSTPFGEGGLAQSGLSMHLRLPPLWAHSLELVTEITNGSNENVFSGQYFSVPSVLLRLVNYWDLSRNTYLQLGLTGMGGFNGRRGIVLDDGPGPEDPPFLESLRRRNTLVGGVDLTLNWEPLNQAKYHHFTWRTEALFIRKDIDTWIPTDTETGVGGLYQGQDPILWWGGYSSLEYKLAQQWIVGVRGDLVQAFETNNDDKYEWQAVPYLTWWQSEFVRMRLEYDFHQPSIGGPDHRVLLQITFAAGPHKHELY
jgi:hypothetical protein